MYTDDELMKFGWEPYHFGENVDVVIVQADHADYKSIGKDDLPGVSTVIDGRNYLDQSKFDGITFRTVGRA